MSTIPPEESTRTMEDFNSQKNFGYILKEKSPSTAKETPVPKESEKGSQEKVLNQVQLRSVENWVNSQMSIPDEETASERKATDEESSKHV